MAVLNDTTIRIALARLGEHLRLEEELDFVRSCLNALARQRGDELGRIEMARQYVEGWEVQP